MANLPLLPARKVLKALSKVGFKQVSQRGSHIKLKKIDEDKTRIVIVPNFNQIPIGTLRSIIRQSGLDIDEFLELL